MKRIAVFSDGTWNSPEHGLPTNVLRMAQAVKPVANGAEQVVFYDWGIGTDQHKIAGGVTGAGIDKNIMDCYRFIIHNFNHGDELFFFGFSRGAYTVRSLAGLIRNCGLLKREHADKVLDAYLLYRQRTKDGHPDSTQATRFRQDYAIEDLTNIEFVGVWDTVGALGIPLPFLGSLGEGDFLFHDAEPSKIIQHARHALSIDENRQHFAPTLWTPKPEVDIKQVWFAGVHSDIGGGFAETGLSHCAMEWIIKEAKVYKFEIEDHLRNTIHADHTDVQHDERKGFYLLSNKLTRNVSEPLHISVKKRWDGNIHNYRNTSKALNKFLASKGNDWSQIEVIQ